MKELIIIATNKCNLKCSHCLRNKKQNSLSLNLFKKILLQAKQIGYDVITFTGGEFCLHDYYDVMVDYTVKNGMKFKIVSNGYKYENYINLFKLYPNKFVHITFSVDGPSKEVHNRIRGVSSFEKVIKAIKHFKSLGVRVNINVCLSKINRQFILEFYNLANKLNVDEIRYLTIIQGDTNNPNALSDYEKNECINDIKSIKTRKKGPIIKVLMSLFANKRVDFCAGLDLNALSVNPQGDLIFCCDTMGDGAIIGSLKDKNLSSLINEARKISDKIKAIRKEFIMKNVHFEGMHTCEFCNKILKERIK